MDSGGSPPIRRNDNQLLSTADMQIVSGDLAGALATLKQFNIHFPYRFETRQLYKQIKALEEMQASALRALSRKSFKKAIKRLKLLQLEMPRNLQIKLLEIECLVQIQGSADEGELLYDRVMEMFCLHQPDHEDKCLKVYLSCLFSYYNGDLESTIQALNTLFNWEPQHQKGKELENKVLLLQRCLLGAEEYFNRNELANTQKCLDEALSVDHNNRIIQKTILHRKVLVYAQMNQVLEAEQAYEQLKILGENPRSMEMLRIRERINEVKNRNAPLEMNDLIGPPVQELQLPHMRPLHRIEDFAVVLDAVMKMKPYQILGLEPHPTLSVDTVRRATHKVLKLYNPDNYVNNPEVHSYCLEIFELIKAAQTAITNEIENNVNS